MKDDIIKLVPNIKVRNIPDELFMQIEVGGYEIKINFRLERPEIEIIHVEEGGWASVKIADPDPDATIDEIVKEAQNLIEKFRRKKSREA